MVNKVGTACARSASSTITRFLFSFFREVPAVPRFADLEFEAGRSLDSLFCKIHAREKRFSKPHDFKGLGFYEGRAAIRWL